MSASMSASTTVSETNTASVLDSSTSPNPFFILAAWSVVILNTLFLELSLLWIIFSLFSLRRNENNEILYIILYIILLYIIFLYIIFYYFIYYFLLFYYILFYFVMITK